MLARDHGHSIYLMPEEPESQTSMRALSGAQFIQPDFHQLQHITAVLQQQKSGLSDVSQLVLIGVFGRGAGQAAHQIFDCAQALRGAEVQVGHWGFGVY